MAHASSSAVRLVVVWIALVVLTVVSLLFSLAHLGSVDIAIALGIATVKTTLVVLFFMHLLEERFSIVMVPFAVVFFVGLLLSLVITDVATRHTFPNAPSLDADNLPGLAD